VWPGRPVIRLIKALLFIVLLFKNNALEDLTPLFSAK
jgi:hypothetical protein